MIRFRRKTTADSKADALAAARKATASARREQRKLERFKRGKQSNPARRMTPHQWIGGGS